MRIERLKGKTVEAIVLAGGLGTRLQHVVSDVPKPMADIGGKPFLSLLLTKLSGQGFRRIILSVGYKQENIRAYFQESYMGMCIDYVSENHPLGTGGAIRSAWESVEEDDVFVFNGDTFYDLDIHRFLMFHKARNGIISMALKPMKTFERYGSVELSEKGRIVSFCEKKMVENGLINGGVYVLNRDLGNVLREKEGVFSFEKDFLELFTDRFDIGGYIDDGYFVDIGVPEDYAKAQKEVNDYL